MKQNWLILGATSAIARAFARSVARSGDALFLAGRDQEDMKRTAADCVARGAASADVLGFDARDAAAFGPIVDRMASLEGQINVAVFVGSMPPQGDIDLDPALIAGTATDGFTGPATMLHMLAPLLEERGCGIVIGVGSVAGDRGRLGNYVYGATKAGFHAYLSGLRNRLARSGVHVMTVKPGMVDTAMTWGLDGLVFLASPEKVAADILRGARKRRNVIYTPWIWWPIMTIIRLIPEPVFKRLKI